MADYKRNEKGQPEIHWLRDGGTYKGVKVMYFGHPEITCKGKPAEVAVVQAMGLQIARATFTNGGDLPAYDEKEFAEFARIDIAKRVLAGE